MGPQRFGAESMLLSQLPLPSIFSVLIIASPLPDASSPYFRSDYYHRLIKELLVIVFFSKLAVYDFVSWAIKLSTSLESIKPISIQEWPPLG